MEQERTHHQRAPEEGAVLTTTEARQGVTSGHVRLMLKLSLALALLVFLALYAVFID